MVGGGRWLCCQAPQRPDLASPTPLLRLHPAPRFEDILPLRVAVGLAPSDGSTGLAPGQLCNDQSSLSDSLHGGVLGRPQVGGGPGRGAEELGD